jgi:hypothetical protein
VELGKMHLGDGGARHGVSFEVRKECDHAVAESSLHFRNRQIGRERRNAVLQLRQLVGDVERQEVAARREHLAELDVDRAERLERFSQPLPTGFPGTAGESPDEDVSRKPRNELVQPEAQADAEDAREPQESRQGTLIKALDALVESCDRVAQARERFGERIELGTAGEELLFVGSIVGHRRSEALRCIEMPGNEGAPRLGKSVRGDVAEEPRQVFFHVPAQLARENQNFRGELGVAIDSYRAQRMLLVPSQRGEKLCLQRHHKPRRGTARLQSAPRKNAEA